MDGEGGASSQPLAQNGDVLFQLRDHFGAFAVVIFRVVINWAVVVCGLEPIKEAATYKAFTERNPFRSAAFRSLFPNEIFNGDGHHVRLHEPRFDRPGRTTFDRGMANVEEVPKIMRVQILDRSPNIPYRATEAFGPRMILNAAENADLFIHRGDLGQTRCHRFDLI